MLVNSVSYQALHDIVPKATFSGTNKSHSTCLMLGAILAQFTPRSEIQSWSVRPLVGVGRICHAHLSVQAVTIRFSGASYTIETLAISVTTQHAMLQDLARLGLYITRRYVSIDINRKHMMRSTCIVCLRLCASLYNCCYF